MISRRESARIKGADLQVLLPQLRVIGFEVWDPLGLRDAFEDGEPMADEYDSYLLQAYAEARRSKNKTQVIAVLKDAEEQMGATTSNWQRSQAARAHIELLNTTKTVRSAAN